MTIDDAAKNVVMLDLALLKAGIETDMFKQPIEVWAEQVHYEPLPPGVRTVIILARQRAGLLRAATVEQMLPRED